MGAVWPLASGSPFLGLHILMCEMKWLEEVLLRGLGALTVVLN